MPMSRSPEDRRLPGAPVFRMWPGQERSDDQADVDMVPGDAG